MIAFLTHDLALIAAIAVERILLLCTYLDRAKLLLLLRICRILLGLARFIHPRLVSCFEQPSVTRVGLLGRLVSDSFIPAIPSRQSQMSSPNQDD
jgi:hypothetical protein